MVSSYLHCVSVEPYTCSDEAGGFIATESFFELNKNAILGNPMPGEPVESTWVKQPVAVSLRLIGCRGYRLGGSEFSGLAGPVIQLSFAAQSTFLSLSSRTLAKLLIKYSFCHQS